MEQTSQLTWSLRSRRASAARLAGNLLLGAFVAAIAGCAKPPPPQPLTTPPSGEGRVGYVRMQQLVEAHPLYPQLHRIELSMDALNLRSLGPGVGQTGSDLSKEDAELQKELYAASARTKEILAQKQAQYQREENAAIDAALAAGGHAAAGGALGAGLGATAQRQAAGVSAQMNRNLQAYANTLGAQEQAQIKAYQQAVSKRIDAEYQAKANQLQSQEQEFALSLATKDAPQRLELRTRLANLALDNTAHQQVSQQLEALDKSESDQVSAMRKRDQQTLAELRTQLRAQGERELRDGVAKIHAADQSKLATAAHSAPAPAALPSGAVTGATLPADLRARLVALHKEYQDRFSRDAQATVEQFTKTRQELQQRYDELHGIDNAASASLQKELASLQSQHDKLYAEIVDQIQREVRIVAQEKGVTTVLSDVSGEGSGVDLTDAAKKEIESLHE